MRLEIPRSATVYTPDTLACAMVCALNDQPNAKWLDPCVGAGVFIQALAQMGVPPDRIAAFDIHRRARASDRFANTVRGVDFIAWTATAARTFDRIVLNPPYVAMTHVKGSLRAAALGLRLPDETKLGLQTNYWCAFLLACLRVLRVGGDLCAVLPAAWDFARYARRIRDCFSNSFGEVIELRSEKPLFSNVVEGSVVILARNFGSQLRRSQRIEVCDITSMVNALANLKLTPQSQVLLHLPRAAKSSFSRIQFCDIARIRIGAVTGDANYFLFNESKRCDLGLPQAALRPVVSRSSHLVSPILNKNSWSKLRTQDERVWLFRPGASALRHPAVQRYLELSELDGGCRRSSFKVASRNTWYETPLPHRVDGFISGMSTRGPFLVLNGMAGLVATNTLYVIHFRRNTSEEEKASAGIALLCSEGREAASKIARVYADGLVKFEPGELARITIPMKRDCRGALDVFNTATNLLLEGQAELAQAVADAWLREDDWTNMMRKHVLVPGDQTRSRLAHREGGR